MRMAMKKPEASALRAYSWIWLNNKTTEAVVPYLSESTASLSVLNYFRKSVSCLRPVSAALKGSFWNAKNFFLLKYAIYLKRIARWYYRAALFLLQNLRYTYSDANSIGYPFLLPFQNNALYSRRLSSEVKFLEKADNRWRYRKLFVNILSFLHDLLWYRITGGFYLCIYTNRRKRTVISIFQSKKSIMCQKSVLAKQPSKVSVI